jgi:hypothetical protein
MASNCILTEFKHILWAKNACRPGVANPGFGIAHEQAGGLCNQSTLFEGVTPKPPA